MISKRQGIAVLGVGAKGIGCECGPPPVKDWSEAELASVLVEAHCVVRPTGRWST